MCDKNRVTKKKEGEKPDAFQCPSEALVHGEIEQTYVCMPLTVAACYSSRHGEEACYLNHSSIKCSQTFSGCDVIGDVSQANSIEKPFLHRARLI